MKKSSDKSNGWGSRRTFLMVMMCQSIGTSGFIVMPNVAVSCGATGYILGYILTYVVLGVPLLYMEYIISQFTTRDCIDIWKICPCLSHIGYVNMFWQIAMLLYNHTITTFVFHYFMISFEDPIPYYQCGPWIRRDCNILLNNYTVNQDCVKKDPKQIKNYCDQLYLTFPECQYWRNYILGVHEEHFHVAWRVCLASGMTCICLFLTCFKRKTSVRWFACLLTIYPMIGYVILMIGSMLQKGIVVMYQDALDLDFSVFMKNGNVSEIIVQVLYALHLGTGLSFNLASSSSFRSPCYSNVLITVLASAAFTVMAVCTYAMMTCPYAYEYNIMPESFMRYQMARIIERTPRLLYQFKHKTFWLLLSFSCNTILGIGTNAIFLLNILEVLVKRFDRAARYPGLLCFAIVFILFLVTIPTLGNTGMNTLVRFCNSINSICILITTLECWVFVLWYGLDRFSEDVHFMQGVQPKNYMKLAWVMSSGVLAYVFCYEVYTGFWKDENRGITVGWWGLVGVLTFLSLVFCINVLIGLWKKRLREVLKFDPMWGPRSELLQRSRAMFSAQAMTKEYMYRQYHLKAGIIDRQRRANIRTPHSITQKSIIGNIDFTDDF